MSVQLHAPASLPPGEKNRYSLDRRLGGPQSRSGRHGEVKILGPTRTETPIPPSVVQPVARSKVLEHYTVHSESIFTGKIALTAIRPPAGCFKASIFDLISMLIGYTYSCHIVCSMKKCFGIMKMETSVTND
jgi:hypothetical protein